MPSSVSLGPPLYCDGPTYDAGVLRYADAAALAYNGASYGGVYQNTGGNRLAVNVLSGLQVTVQPGTAIIPSAAGSTDGAYRVTNNQSRTLTCATADGTNPRIDLVVIGVQENGNNTSNGFVQIVTGTPAPIPAAPAAPPNTIGLCQVTVGANVTNLTSGNLADARVFQVAPGGILPVSPSSSPAGANGQYAYDATNDRLYHMALAGNRQARVLPWAPLIVKNVANVSNTGSETTILSLNFATDGQTDVHIWCKWRGILVASSGGLDMRAQMILKIDGTQVSDLEAYNPRNDGNSRGGGILDHYTSSHTGDTPGSGNHTVTWSFVQNYSGSLNVAADGNTTSPLMLRIAPVTL